MAVTSKDCGEKQKMAPKRMIGVLKGRPDKMLVFILGNELILSSLTKPCSPF